MHTSKYRVLKLGNHNTPKVFQLEKREREREPKELLPMQRLHIKEGQNQLYNMRGKHQHASRLRWSCDGGTMEAAVAEVVPANVVNVAHLLECNEPRRGEACQKTLPSTSLGPARWSNSMPNVRGVCRVQPKSGVSMLSRPASICGNAILSLFMDLGVHATCMVCAAAAAAATATTYAASAITG